VVSRLVEIVLDEAILTAKVSLSRLAICWPAVSPSAVPEIEHEVSHELDVAVLDVDCRAQPTDIFGDIVTEDDASHRRLASSALAHQQYLALLLPLDRIHPGSPGRRWELLSESATRWDVQNSLVVNLKLVAKAE